jgi:hypothetical protein
MKMNLNKFFLAFLLSIYFLPAVAQLSSVKDTVICDLYPNERNEFSAYIENSGNDSINYTYELVSENVTQLTSWDIEFCDCFECLIGLIQSGDCTIQPSESFSFKYYVTLPVDVKEYTETYVTYKVTSKTDSTNVDTFTYITRKAPDAPEVSVNEFQLEESSVSIYPNPTEGIINISFDALSKDPYILSVMNILGELVYSSVLELNSVNNHVESQLDFRDFQKGAYFLTLSNGEEVKTERLTIK